MLSEEMRRLAGIYAGHLTPLRTEIQAAKADGTVVFERQDLATLLNGWADRVQELEVYRRLLAKVTDTLLTDPELVALAVEQDEEPPRPTDGSAA